MFSIKVYFVKSSSSKDHGIYIMHYDVSFCINKKAYNKYIQL